MLDKGIPTLLRKERLCKPSSVTSFPHTHLCRSQFFQPYRNPIAILRCLFDSFNLKFLHGMKFKPWEPNLSWKLLNLFTSVGSSRKLTQQLRCQELALSNFFWFSFYPLLLIKSFDKICNSRLLKSHMKLKKNRPYKQWLKSQGHYLLCFSTSNSRSQFGSLAT